MHALPAIRAVVLLRRRGMNPYAHLWGEALSPAVIEERALNGHAALDRRAGCPEGHEEAVAGMIDFLEVDTMFSSAASGATRSTTPRASEERTTVYHSVGFAAVLRERQAQCGASGHRVGRQFDHSFQGEERA
jgi:hypothetical protein